MYYTMYVRMHIAYGELRGGARRVVPRPCDGLIPLFEVHHHGAVRRAEDSPRITFLICQHCKLTARWMETPQGSPMAAIDTPSHQQATEQTVQSSQAREDGSVSALGAGQVAVSDGGHDVQQKDCNSSKTITAERSDEPNRTDLYNGSPTPALAAGVEVGEPQSAHWVSTEEATSVDWRREPLELQGLDTSWRSSLVIQHRGQGPGRRGDGEDSPYLSLSLSSNSSHQENVTVGVGSYQSEASCSLTLSQQQAIGYHTLSTSSPLTSVRDPHSGNPLGWAGEGSEGGGAYEPIAESPNEPDSQPKPGSPFLVVQKSDVNDMSKFESPGLLYARASKREHDRLVE